MAVDHEDAQQLKSSQGKEPDALHLLEERCWRPSLSSYHGIKQDGVQAPDRAS